MATFITERKQALFLVNLITFLFVSLSFPAGGDWVGYFNNYDCIVNSKCYSDFSSFEIGYQLIVAIFGNLGFQFTVVFIAFVNAISLFNFAQKFENGALIIFFIMCVFLWSLYVEAVRQSLAMSILLIALIYLYSRKIKKYIYLIILASFFHVTALICLIFIIPYFSARLTKLVGFGLLVLSIIFITFPTSILEYIVLFLLPNSMVGMKLNFYLYSDAYSPQVSIGLGSILDFLLICIIFLSFWRANKNQLFTNYSFHGVVFLGVSLYLAFGISIGKMMPVMTRIGWYGFPFVIILIYLNIGRSLFYNKFISTSKQDLTGILICIYFVLQILRPLTYEYSNYGIFQQKTIIQKFDSLDDYSLRIDAKEKCSDLSKLGYGYLCSN